MERILYRAGPVVVARPHSCDCTGKAINKAMYHYLVANKPWVNVSSKLRRLAGAHHVDRHDAKASWALLQRTGAVGCYVDPMALARHERGRTPLEPAGAEQCALDARVLQ
jgi:hypothetical protein